MSHASAEVTLEDGRVLYAEYDGTCDIARSSVRLTMDEVREKWRQVDDRVCTCGDAVVRTPAVYFADYGGGVQFDTHVCVSCMVLVGYRSKAEQLDEEYTRDAWCTFGCGYLGTPDTD